MKIQLLTAFALAAATTLPAHAALSIDAGAIAGAVADTKAGPSAVVDIQACDGLLTSGPE